MYVYQEVKEMLEKALEDVSRKGELTSGNLDIIDKLTHAIKSVDTIEAMERKSYAESSFDGHDRYSERRRDSMGRYTRDADRNEIIAEMHELKKRVSDEHTRREIENLIDRLK